MEGTKFSTIDEYIAAWPGEVQARLGQVRAAVKSAAPGAVEKISYNMPSFSYHGRLVYFAAAKNHIGFYGTTDNVIKAIPQAAAYKTSTGTLQFPHKDPLPLELIGRIVKLRATENESKEKTRPRLR
jgi:uncharacterized protein YdhG (YjbR/CyaY superfamily)